MEALKEPLGVGIKLRHFRTFSMRFPPLPTMPQAGSYPAAGYSRADLWVMIRNRSHVSSLMPDQIDGAFLELSCGTGRLSKSHRLYGVSAMALTGRAPAYPRNAVPGNSSRFSAPPFPSSVFMRSSALWWIFLSAFPRLLSTS